MPEGDTIHQAQRRLEPVLTGYDTTAFWARKLKGHRPRAGMPITAVRAHGKHLLIDFEAPSGKTLTLDTHVGMVGSWRVAPLTKPVLDPAGGRGPSDPKVRVVVATEAGQAVCRAAPSITSFLHDGDAVSAQPDRLGPDLTVPEPDLGTILDRAQARLTRAETDRTPVSAAELLMDQWVAAGIGNVYKSEVLFIEGIWPFVDAARLSIDQLERIYGHASRLLHLNVRPGFRDTTGRGGHFVYGRHRLPCLVCSTPVERAYRGLQPLAREGVPHRSTYWCPRCQPESGSRARR